MYPPVLYAEDEENDAFFMQDAWRHAGVPNPLVIVTDGDLAIAYLSGQAPFEDREKHPLPCLLLLDLALRQKDEGFRVLEWVRSHPTLNNLKAVIVSGSELQTDIARAEDLGITDYIVKPSAPSRLAEILVES